MVSARRLRCWRSLGPSDHRARLHHARGNFSSARCSSPCRSAHRGGHPGMVSRCVARGRPRMDMARRIVGSSVRCHRYGSLLALAANLGRPSLPTFYKDSNAFRLRLRHGAGTLGCIRRGPTRRGVSWAPGPPGTCAVHRTCRSNDVPGPGDTPNSTHHAAGGDLRGVRLVDRPTRVGISHPGGRSDRGSPPRARLRAFYPARGTWPHRSWRRRPGNGHRIVGRCQHGLADGSRSSKGWRVRLVDRTRSCRCSLNGPVPRASCRCFHRASTAVRRRSSHDHSSG